MRSVFLLLLFSLPSASLMAQAKPKRPSTITAPCVSTLEAFIDQFNRAVRGADPELMKPLLSKRVLHENSYGTRSDWGAVTTGVTIAKRAGEFARRLNGNTFSQVYITQDAVIKRGEGEKGVACGRYGLVGGEEFVTIHTKEGGEGVSYHLRKFNGCFELYEVFFHG